MSRKTRVVFLWHMHQPYYKDAGKGTYLMPWVRLHCLKGYYDIPLAMEKFGVKGVVNVVPSLLEQIIDYTENGATDPWLDHTRYNPAEMSKDQKGFVLKNFFMLHWDRLVKTSPRYHELLNKRLRYEKKLNWDEMANLFTNEELFDLQVLFNLKWFGFMALERYPELKALDNKDRSFTQNDKETVLEVMNKIMKEIIPLYKRLKEEDVVELSFTPFYHPILPLIIDTDISARSSGAPLPDRFSYPEDASWHIEEGKRYCEELWGDKIAGMWPSEGSVSPEIIPLVAKSGVKWIATDEGVLLNSLGTSDKSSVLFRPYRLKVNENECVAGFFRDKYLSDLLGFSFSRMEPVKAVDTFMNYVKSINYNLPQGHPDPVVSVILDGENAWESYPEDGKLFLEEFFGRLGNNPDIETTTFSKVLEEEEKEIMQPISRIFSGSWINSNYEIWIGNEEDNTGWEYLKRVRDFYERFRSENEVDPETDKEVMLSLYRAEGSDWFWWYGPQFSTENDWLFDRLFRRHLRRVYYLLGVDTPSFLDIPISSSSGVNVNIQPTALIKPWITGRNESYYEWSGAGVFENVKRSGEAMYNSIKMIDSLYYGFDRDHIFFKMHLVGKLSFYEHKKYFLRGFIMNSKDLDFTLPLIRMGAVDFSVKANSGNEFMMEIVGAGLAAFDEIVEMKINSLKAGLKPGEKIGVYFKIISSDGVELERVPSNGSIELTIPDDNMLYTFWDV